MKSHEAILLYLLFVLLPLPSVAQERNSTEESAARVIEKVMMNSGIEAAVKKFHELRYGSVEEYSFVETEFNALGYRLIQSGKIVEAVEVFKMNVVLYPASSNMYDSLGEAYIYLGDRERAIASYEKVLELNQNYQIFFHHQRNWLLRKRLSK